MSKTHHPDLFRYHDYREYLKDWLASKKASQSGFSLRQWARQTGLAVSYLSMVLKGSRNLTQQATQKILPHLHLNSPEKSYFQALVTLGSSDSQKQRVEALKKMKRYQAYRRQNPKETEVYQYLTHWYYVAIREMTALADFKADPEWIQAHLRYPVDLASIKKAIEFLKANQFIQIRDDQSATPPEKNLDCLGGVFRVALTEFHHELLDLAKKSITDVPSAERSLLGHTFALDSQQLEKAKRILETALQEIKDLEANSKCKDTIYQIELALFPISKRSKS